MLVPVIVKRLDPSERANASHGWFVIRIKDDLPFRAAVLAQEWKEETHLFVTNRLGQFTISNGAAIALLWSLNPILAVTAGITGGFILSRLTKQFVDETMEIEGHMVEAVFAMEMIRRGDVDLERYPQIEGVTPEGYLLLEAIALTNYKQFRDKWTRSGIINAMEAFRPDAEKWVQKHYKKVMDKHYATLPKSFKVQS